MRQSLHNFFAKTGQSRSSLEYLLRFHSLPDERFLLLIPAKLESEQDWRHILAETAHLLQLNLSPTFLLSAHFFRPAAIRRMKADLRRLQHRYKESPLFFCEEELGEDLAATLQRVAEEQDFHKYLLVHPPLQDASGQTLDRVTLRSYHGGWDADSAKIMAWLAPFLGHRGPASSVQVAAPDRILQELFTSTGSGTFVSLGYRFNLLPAAKVPRERLRRLIERGFGRKLRREYFGELGRNWRVMAEDNWRAAVVLMDTGYFTYLDKVVVAPEYFGQGLGSLLLEELCQKIEEITSDLPRLAWRAKHENPYLARYGALIRQQALRQPFKCGTVIDDHYVYHFMGLPERDRSAALRFMTQRPGSFND